MRYITIGRYQVSIFFLVAVLIVASTVLGGAYYMWASKVMTISIEEPLSITNFPNSLNVHPGENQTLDITIINSATLNYYVTLVFVLNDTLFQESYVTFGNYTYNITPGTNQIKAWIAVSQRAHAATLNLTVDFFRN